LCDNAPQQQLMADFSDSLPSFHEMGVSVFANPYAGAGRAVEYLSRVQEFLRAHNIPARTAITASADELERATSEAISQDQRILLAMGGDGTFQALANASFGCDVLLGILPAGGGNDFAAALGIPSNLQAVLDGMLEYSVRRLDLVRAHTADGKTRLYVGGGGIGLDAEAAHLATANYRHLPGRIRYVAAGLRALLEFKPPQARIEFPGSDLPPAQASCLLTAVLNTPTYGAGLRLAPEASVDDGFLHVIQIEDIGMLGVLRLLPRVILTGEVRSTRIRRWRATRVRLLADPPCSFHGDGEVLGPTPVDIEILPRAMRVLAPVVD